MTMTMRASDAMAPVRETSRSASQALKMRVEGMDCGACAVKIENALKRLPGVGDISVNYGAEMLTLTLDEDRTSRTAIEDKMRALGYTPLPEHPSDAFKKTADTDRESLWHTGTRRVVPSSGVLLVAAFAIAHAAPALSFWAYLLVAFVGFVPIARRAIAGATSGTPFGIETLMSVAVLGAIAIGAAEEAAVVIFLLAVGELLENVAACRARAGIKTVMNLVPRRARLEEHGETREVPVEELRTGDIVLVRPCDRVPSDGEVIQGESEVDEAPVTGE